MTCYNEHNNFRTSKNMEYYIETGCDRQVFVQGGFQLRRNFGEAVARVHHDLAVDFNSYKFFCDILKNTPPRFRFFALNEAVLDLCKLLDERRNNKLALSNILGNIYLNITEDKMKQEFILFQNSIESWLCSKSEFIKILKTI